MKKAITVLFCAGLLLIGAAAAWASDECYTLSGADYFGGDMTLGLAIQAPPEGGDVYAVYGIGKDSQGHSVLIQGSTQSSAHVKEFSLRGSGPIGAGRHGDVWAIYEYHLTLGPGGSGWTGNYAGEIHTTDGAEKDVSGAATGINCSQVQVQAR